jgi:hypothetical protein
MYKYTSELRADELGTNSMHKNITTETKSGNYYRWPDVGKHYLFCTKNECLMVQVTPPSGKS